MKLSIKENSSEFYKNLKFEDIPETLPSQISLLKRNGIYGFKVGNIVGIVPLNNEMYLSIVLKYNDLNLIDMLCFVEGIDNKNKNDEIADYLTLGDNSLINKFFLKKFVNSLEIINSQSLKFARKKQSVQISSVRGNVNWKNSKLNLKKRKQNPIESKVFKVDYEIPENIILAAAAKISLDYFEKFSYEWFILEEWANKFRVSKVQNHLGAIISKLSEDRISGSRSYYREAIIYAKLILDLYGVNSGDDIGANSLLINAPDLYEKYIRKACQIEFTKRGIIVQKGFQLNEYLLQNEIELVPDLTFYKSNNLLAVGDIKYKEPTPSDFHQMYCYLKKTSCNTGVIFTPQKGSIRTQPLLKKQSFDGINFYILEIPNSNLLAVYESLELLKTNSII